MCVSFNQKFETGVSVILETLLGFDVRVDSELGRAILESKSIRETCYPHRQAWVVFNQQFVQQNFSLVPSWSKVRRPKFATHNARVESLLEKPTWRAPLRNAHGVVPMTDFFESGTGDEWGGHRIQIIPKPRVSSNIELIWAASLHSEWIDPSTGEVISSFCLITHEADAQISKIGHDRSPLFLKPDAIPEWLNPKARGAEEWVPWLLSNCSRPEFGFVKATPIKKSKIV